MLFYRLSFFCTTSYNENFLIPIQLGSITMKAIAYTGAFSSAMSQKHFDKIYNDLTQKPIKKASPEITVSTAFMPFMHQSQILFTKNLFFKIGHLELTEDLRVFEKLSGILLGFPFFDKNEIRMDAHNCYQPFPDFTLQLNLMQTAGSKTSKRFNNKRQIYLKTTTRVIINHGEHKLTNSCLVNH